MSATPPPPVSLDDVKIDPAWALRVPAVLALRRQVLPLACVDGKIFVACSDPSDTTALEAVERFTGFPAVVTHVERGSLQRALQRVYAEPSRASRAANASGRQDTLAGADDPVALSSELLHAAILRQASDIHLEPTRDDLRVRLRADGMLEEYARLPLAAYMPLISRFKVLAGMDIAEKRAPQDGGFTHRYGPQPQRAVDLRVATLPTKYGERMTLRLLALQMESLDLKSLGFSPLDFARVEHFLEKPQGLALLTGPTGSGKTTTLYACIRRLLTMAEWNIITIEDPIEYDIPGVSQVEVDSADKVSFSKALRSALRHDPDILMIGEIRDPDTLDVAVKAALTGHLVLATLHTNNAASAVTRLADMGLERYLISATLCLSLAQRLVRRLCPHCRTPRLMTAVEARTFGVPNLEGQTVYEPKGCVYCAGRGFAGRVGLFEIMSVNDSLAAQIAAGVQEEALNKEMRAQGVPSLMEDAAKKVLAGTTTVREALETTATR